VLPLESQIPIIDLVLINHLFRDLLMQPQALVFSIEFAIQVKRIATAENIENSSNKLI
jgi:hypothetical protein